MKKQLCVLALAAVGLAAVPTVANAARRDRVSSNKSCVDMNNDGICGTGDKPLKPQLEDHVLDTTRDFPQASARGGAIGVVIDDTSFGGGAVIVASGDVHLGRSVRGGDFLNVVAKGDLVIAPNTRITGGFTVNLNAVPGSNVIVGDGADIRASDGAVAITGTNVTIGNDVRLNGASGGVNVQASGALHVGEGLIANSPAAHGRERGAVTLAGNSDVTLDDMSVSASDLRVYANGAANLPARHIRISDSVVELRNKWENSQLTVKAAPGTGGAPSIVLEHTKLAPERLQYNVSSSPLAQIVG
jgi:hypothetical protein